MRGGFMRKRIMRRSDGDVHACFLLRQYQQQAAVLRKKACFTQASG